MCAGTVGWHTGYPERCIPFKGLGDDTIEERHQDARKTTDEQEPGSDITFPLDQEDDGHLSIGAYPGGFLASEPESE